MLINNSAYQELIKADKALVVTLDRTGFHNIQRDDYFFESFITVDFLSDLNTIFEKKTTKKIISKVLPTNLYAFLNENFKVFLVSGESIFRITSQDLDWVNSVVNAKVV